LIDWDSALGRAARELLARERVAWLTTVRADGSPWPNPVWFLPEGETVLVYSLAGSAKNRHLVRNPRVTLHFNGEGWTRDIAVFDGQAEVDASASPPDTNDAYLGKYGDDIPRIGLTPTEYAVRYPVAVRVTLTGLRGH
jgi:PPOX class probable F420-dependent enzyme